MTPEVVTAGFTGLVALIGAIAAATSARSRRRGNELRELQREVRELRTQQRLSDRWSGQVLRAANFHGWHLPAPPEGLFDELIPEPAQPDPDPASADDRPGRRRRPEA